MRRRACLTLPGENTAHTHEDAPCREKQCNEFS
jgi:hypothetical protein